MQRINEDFKHKGNKNRKELKHKKMDTYKLL